MAFRKPNDYYMDENNVVHVILRNSALELLCDPDVWSTACNYTWFATTQGYARSDTGSGYILFHRYVIPNQSDYDIDHINGNPLDNRRCNLRVCTHQENSRNLKVCKKNTSGVTGVYWRTRSKRWVAQIMVNGRQITLGYFKDFQDAVKCRKDAEKRFFGSYVRGVEV